MENEGGYPFIFSVHRGWGSLVKQNTASKDTCTTHGYFRPSRNLRIPSQCRHVEAYAETCMVYFLRKAYHSGRINQVCTQSSLRHRSSNMLPRLPSSSAWQLMHPYANVETSKPRIDTWQTTGRSITPSAATEGKRSLPSSPEPASYLRCT